MRLKGKNFLLSILLPFRNEEKYLRECLESVLNQSFREWELILIDDHSSDGSYQIASEFSQKDSRIRLFKNAGKGLIDALKYALEQSTGTFISRMDADDVCKLHKYEEMMGLWEGKGSVVCGKVKYFSDEVLQEGYRRYGVWLNTVIGARNPWRFVYEECVVPSPSWLIHQDDLDGIGGISAGIYPEDYDLAFRMYGAGYRIISTDTVVHLWRDHVARNSRTNELYANHFFPDLKAHYFKVHELSQAGRAVIWGAGKRAKQLIHELQELNVKPNWFTNNPKKLGKDIYGLLLEDEDEYQPQEGDKIAVVISADNERKEVMERFETLNLIRGEDYWFFC